MGFTPSLVSGCWVGGDERDIHFGRMTLWSGSCRCFAYLGNVYEESV